MAVNSVNGSGAPQVTGAIQQAARSTGASFDYLLATARMESNLNPQARAQSSSAQGLYQFVDQTWLATMKQAGPSLGFGRYAAAIVQGPDGRYDVPDPDMRTAIMELRANPSASAIMAGAFARSNAAQLQTALGRPPTEAELYIAHFLGSDGAQKLIGMASKNPQAIAADIFPAAAAANRSVFFNGFGRARSVAEVYSELTSRFGAARADAQATHAPFLATLRGVSPVLSAGGDPNAESPALPDTKPLFQAMFTDRPRTPVAPVVSDLWAHGGVGQPLSLTPVDSSAPRQPLDLFSDGAADARKLFGGT
ncbi:MAG TPA: transglycosylase SLT domain-containing protein [Pseudolabrys sp.]|jgi:hypothetical protein|nr:transglycosylase SLT domain-containing protein [Pseudolabrys sp.]